MALESLREITKKGITVGFLFDSNKDRLKWRSINENIGFDLQVTNRNIHRPGLALAGYVELFAYDRVQIFGNTEIRYLNHLDSNNRKKAFERLLQFAIPCIVVTNNNELDEDLIELATRKGVPILQTPFETTKLTYFLGDFLEDQFAPQTVVHGSFIDVYGIGILLIGRSGIGKSEIALDLIERGHRLVADDVVMVTRKGEGILIGAGTDVVKHFMEIRGLGFIDIQSMFGIRAIRFQKRVEVVVELLEWKPDAEYTRTGLDNDLISIMGVEIPHIRLPIFPGKNVTVITEVIALNYLLKHYGFNAAKEFAQRLEATIASKSKGKRVIDYFEHDFE